MNNQNSQATPLLPTLRRSLNDQCRNTVTNVPVSRAKQSCACKLLILTIQMYTLKKKQEVKSQLEFLRRPFFFFDSAFKWRATEPDRLDRTGNFPDMFPHVNPLFFFADEVPVSVQPVHMAFTPPLKRVTCTVSVYWIIRTLWTLWDPHAFERSCSLHREKNGKEFQNATLCTYGLKHFKGYNKVQMYII